MNLPQIALAQINPILGDFAGNAQKIAQNYLELCQGSNPPEMVVFSEMCLSGYPLMDLIEYPGLIETQDAEIQKLLKLTRQYQSTLVIGGVSPNKGSGKPFFNSVFVLDQGQIVLTSHKQLLPTYNVFDEARHFEAGTHTGTWCKNGINYAFLICEDIWDLETRLYAQNPFAGIESADLLITLNASPSNIGKREARLQIAQSITQKFNLGLVYVNQVGAQDALVFDGNSFVMNPSGEIIAHLGSFVEDSKTCNLNTTTSIVIEQEIPCQTLYHHAVMGIRDYVRKCGFQKVVVGSSGGVDSALVLALAVDALGSDHVQAITMPSHFSSQGSWVDSEVLCANLGIELLNINIAEIYASFLQNFEEATQSKGIFDLANENTQARIRGSLLMAYSNRYGHLLLTTGNKSELSVGYATLYGDMNGGLNPIGDLYKTEVFELCRWYNQLHQREIIPATIINKEPSAELRPDQKDQDSLPPYEILDLILRMILEHKSPYFGQWRTQLHQKTNMAERIEMTTRVVDLLAKAEFKRKQACPIIRCQNIAFGFGRNIPIAQAKGIHKGLIQHICQPN